MWIKICGTTGLADALLSIEHGADALGFIFAPSKRRVTAEQAAAVTAHLPAGIERVGVFTSDDVSAIVETVALVGLTAVQLHLPHDPALTAELSQRLGKRIRLIQVVGVTADPTSQATTPHGNTARLRAAFADPALWAVLLDTEKDGRSGGLGVAFSWSALQPALESVLRPALHRGTADHLTSPKLLLAGGLHAANVAEAIGTLQPWGVDCVSGVEAAPGRKDPVRLAEFIQAVRRSGQAAEGRVR